MLGIRDTAPKPTTIASLKRHAKAVKKAQGIPLQAAQNEVAKHFGWSNFRHAQSELI